MSQASHVEMHRDHQQWKSENDLWRTEVATWEQTVHRALGELPKVETAFRAHLMRLQQYLASVRLYEAGCCQHEHALAQSERGETGADLVGLASGHDHEAQQHTTRREEYNKLRDQHHEWMARWNSLLHVVSDSSANSGQP